MKRLEIGDDDMPDGQQQPRMVAIAHAAEVVLERTGALGEEQWRLEAVLDDFFARLCGVGLSEPLPEAEPGARCDVANDCGVAGEIEHILEMLRTSVNERHKHLRSLRERCAVRSAELLGGGGGEGILLTEDVAQEYQDAVTERFTQAPCDIVPAVESEG